MRGRQEPSQGQTVSTRGLQAAHARHRAALVSRVLHARAAANLSVNQCREHEICGTHGLSRVICHIGTAQYPCASELRESAQRRGQAMPDVTADTPSCPLARHPPPSSPMYGDWPILGCVTEASKRLPYIATRTTPAIGLRKASRTKKAKTGL